MISKSWFTNCACSSVLWNSSRQDAWERGFTMSGPRLWDISATREVKHSSCLCSKAGLYSKSIRCMPWAMLALFVKLERTLLWATGSTPAAIPLSEPNRTEPKSLIILRTYFPSSIQPPNDETTPRLHDHSHIWPKADMSQHLPHPAPIRLDRRSAAPDFGRKTYLKFAFFA